MDELELHPLSIEGAYAIHLPYIEDERGSFQRLYSNDQFSDICGKKAIANINSSRTIQKGTIRGLHFQHPPFTEVKIVKCLRGSVWDVVVDVRKNSPTFLQWESIKLSQNNHKMVFIPEGVAHGFQSLEDNCELLYLHTAVYSKESEDGLRFDDPVLNINWPLPIKVVSARDKSHELIIPEKFKGVSL